MIPKYNEFFKESKENGKGRMTAFKRSRLSKNSNFSVFLYIEIQKLSEKFGRICPRMGQLEFMLSHIYDVYIRYVAARRIIKFCHKPYVAYEYTTYIKATYTYVSRAATYGYISYVYRICAWKI
jgi:hypothetical protein